MYIRKVLESMNDLNKTKMFMTRWLEEFGI